jgi:hypothetical protein
MPYTARRGMVVIHLLLTSEFSCTSRPSSSTSTSHCAPSMGSIFREGHLTVIE